MKTDASRLPPNAAMDTHICKLVASSLAGAATLLAASLLAGASRTWAMLRAGRSADDIMREQEDLLDQVRASWHRGLSMGCACCFCRPADGMLRKQEDLVDSCP